jgi:hypothetical protein
MNGYIKYKSKIINGKKRCIYVKNNSKSDNPRLYIVKNGKMISYKQFIKNKTYNGGISPMFNFDQNNTIHISYPFFTYNMLKSFFNTNNLQIRNYGLSYRITYQNNTTINKRSNLKHFIDYVNWNANPELKNKSFYDRAKLLNEMPNNNVIRVSDIELFRI